MSEYFYLQDSRSFVGNDMVWWRLGGGYTTNLLEAEVFTKERAESLHQGRESDIPWPRDYIASKTRPAVDMQYVNKKEIEKAGIKLVKPKRPRKPSAFNCWGCGKFVSENDRYGYCPHCGEDNRP